MSRRYDVVPLISDPRILRIDQVGSLLRPAWLKELYAQHATGEITSDALREGQDRAIREAVARQEQLHLPIVTDGEFRRLNFQDSFANAVTGFAATANTIAFHTERVEGGAPGQRWDPGYTGHGPAVMHRRPVVERIRLINNQPRDEYVFTTSITTRPVKVTLIGPDRIIQRYDYEGSRAVYPEIDDFVTDLISVEREMVTQIVAAGCRYVHIDAPGYTAYVDEPSLAQMRARGEDPAENLERSMRADNQIIADFPDVTFGIHLCRGNQASMWHREGHYDAIAERLFNTLQHQRLLLEYDTDRAGGFEPLRFVPAGKIVVLGLVSTKTGRIETADELERRIADASRYLPIEQLAISPQCGFASDIVGNNLTSDDQWRKLEVIQEVAGRVWK